MRSYYSLTINKTRFISTLFYIIKKNLKLILYNEDIRNINIVRDSLLLEISNLLAR